MAALAVSAALFAATAHAATRIKQDNALDLHLAGSWDTPPTAGDVALWTNTVTGANSTLLGADLSWQGIRVANPGGAVTIGGTNTLTIGTAGIDLGQATQNLTLNCGLALLGQQSWRAAAGRTLDIAGPLTRAGAVVNFTNFHATAVLGTLTNDASGILGPWATTGGGTTLHYAASTAGKVLPFSNQTVATAADLSNVTNASGNYTFATNATLVSALSAHTLRFTGSNAFLMNNGFSITLNGLMNAGPDALTIQGAGPLVIGTNRELVIAAAKNVTINNTITNNPGGASSLTFSGAGATLFLNGTNSYTGGTTINAGTVEPGNLNNFALGAPVGGLVGPVTIHSNATLKLSRQALTANVIMVGGTLGGGNSFSDTLSGFVTLQTGSFIDPGGTGNRIIAADVSGPGGWTKLGTGKAAFSGNSSFRGPVAVSGSLTVGSLNSVSGGTPTSNLGAPTNAAGGTITLGSGTTAGNLIYTGAGETTDRIIQLGGSTGGGTITQSGFPAGLPTSRGVSGLLKFTSDVSVPGVAAADNRKTLTLAHAGTADFGSTPGEAEMAGRIGDSLIGNTGQLATTVAKTGLGTWRLSGTNTYTGATRVLSGTLVCTHPGALGGGAVDITNGTARLQLDFIGTRQVASLTLDGIPQPNGTYGSSSSPAGVKDDAHFAGRGTVTVGPLANPTTVALARTGGSNPSSGGASLTFTATVTGNAPTGGVTLYDGLTPIAAGILNGSYEAVFQISTLTGGLHSLVALYQGDASNAPSASTILSHTVVDTRPASSVTIARTSGANPSIPGAAVEFTATVSGNAPTGTVDFLDGMTLLGSSPLDGSGQAVLPVSSLASGWHSITARFAGDSNNAPSVSSPALWHTVKPAAGTGKVKVFILAGQSNMQGKGLVENGRDPGNPTNYAAPLVAGGYGSLRHMLNADPDRYGYLADTNNPTDSTVPGWRTMTNVWVSYWTDNGTNRHGILDADFGNLTRGGRIGPEYGFGLLVGSQLGDQVLLIKTAWGGKSLQVDFRPPSSGGTVGPFYTNMVGIVHRVLDNLGTYFPSYSGGGYEIAGFGWHQGWNDRSAVPAAEYETNLVNLIKDIRTEFGVSNLPFVITTTGMANTDNDGTGVALLLCSKQAAVANPVLHPELAGTVITVDTRPFDYGLAFGSSTESYHWNWNAESYFKNGQCMGRAMMKLLSSRPFVTNSPAVNVSTNSAVLGANILWPFTPCTGVAYWDTVNHGTNASAWTGSAVAGSWTNRTTTYPYGLPGDYVYESGVPPVLAATNLGFTATGLAPNTTYYFTFAATNRTVSNMARTNMETLWATNVLSFTTLGTGAPVPPVPALSSGAFSPVGAQPGFTFGTAAGFRYRMTYNEMLTSPGWLPLLSTNFPAPDGWSAVSTGAVMSVIDTNAAGPTQRFYRIEAAAP